MPCKKNKLSPSKPKCTLSSLRLSEALETESLQNLCPGVCVPSSEQVNEPDPTETGTCYCEEDVSTPVTCCPLDPQREESIKFCPAQEPEIPTCVSNSQAIQLEAMIDEIRICRGIIRKLALEAMDILHPENLQQCKQNLQAKQAPIANAKVSCCELQDDSEANPIVPASHAKPIDLKRTSDCTKKKCELTDPRTYSSSEGQSTAPLFPIPPTLLRSPALSRKSSDPIAQTACQIKDSRLGQAVRKKSFECICDRTMNSKTLGKQPSNCGCDGGKKKKADCRCDAKPESELDCKSFIQKKFGKRPSNNSYDGKKKQNTGCCCDETMNSKNTLGNKPSCGCDDGEKKQNINCSCDDAMMKQNKENEKRENKTNSKSCLEKMDGECMRSNKDDRICNDKEMGKQNRAKDKYKASSVSAACARPKCEANTCSCHFPPAYSQYFDCTGHVSGNCHCDKNA